MVSECSALLICLCFCYVVFSELFYIVHYYLKHPPTSNRLVTEYLNVQNVVEEVNLAEICELK